ncbi:T3SS (YopN, CesT) and YbjN peptide-binding chaperone 1 [Mycolicibacterium austroafricanum]|uniref:T3SS (YopN, CesT) and YbjN peptide-binding chaperone 1 n=1 Tax=Mycolicibacterium austroafricanum TaxID=39687 RepID=UPI000CFA6460|nr:YbjN domain-containing protein [Mycolicibacterium austroafricanum]PQP39972.1 hypothetical protein C6A88_31855 [Mycolicibacterium austroafricanum]
MSRFAPRAQSNSLISKIFGSSDQNQAHELNEWLENTLKRELEVDHIERDDDGDISIPVGSAVVFVRVCNEDPPHIEIFAPLLEDFAIRPEVYESVNAINRQTRIVKAVVSPEHNQIVLSAELFIFDGGLSSDQLMVTIDIVADRADHYDTLLQKRFGGRTMLDDDQGDEFDV